MSKFVRLQDLQAHLSHDLVVGLLQDPVSKTVLSRCFPRHEIDICDCDMRVRITALTIKMHNDIARRVRRNLLRECIGSISDDHRRQRITRIKLVLRERLNHHERLILTTTPFEHRLNRLNRVVRASEVRTPCSRTRMIHVSRSPVMRIHDWCCCSHRRRLLRDTHALNSFAIARSFTVARRKSSTSGSTPAHPCRVSWLTLTPTALTSAVNRNTSRLTSFGSGAPSR